MYAMLKLTVANSVQYVNTPWYMWVVK